MPNRSAILLVLLTACATPRSPAAPPPVEVPEPEFQFPHHEVWTARPGVSVATDSVSTAPVARPFSRLQVLQADTAGVHVRCDVCPDRVEGRVGWEGVIFEPGEPAAAALGSISQFALAIRHGAERRDLEALRRVMARDFTYSLIGPQGRESALAVWQEEGFVALDQVPALLDGGLVTRDGVLWAAPAAHLTEHGYRGYRIGFTATPDGRWEWTFLIRGERP